MTNTQLNKEKFLSRSIGGNEKIWDAGSKTRRRF